MNKEIKTNNKELKSHIGYRCIIIRVKGPLVSYGAGMARVVIHFENDNTYF
jgi:hypothetical protein